MEHLIKFDELFEDSATGGPAGAVSGGGYVNSQPSSLPGVTTNPTYAATGGTDGDYASVPFNTMSKQYVMGKEHGAMTGKKSRTKKLDMKKLKDIFANRQDYTAGQSKVDKKQRVMDFEDFQKADINQVKK
jgi:hypothetical protein